MMRCFRLGGRSPNSSPLSAYDPQYLPTLLVHVTVSECVFVFAWMWKGNVEIYVCICEHLGTGMAMKWSWWGLGYRLRSTRMLTHAAQMLDAPLSNPLELETGSFHTWGKLQRLPPAAGWAHHQQFTASLGYLPFVVHSSWIPPSPSRNATSQSCFLWWNLRYMCYVCCITRHYANNALMYFYMYSMLMVWQASVMSPVVKVVHNTTM